MPVAGIAKSVCGAGRLSRVALKLQRCGRAESQGLVRSWRLRFRGLAALAGAMPRIGATWPSLVGGA